MGSEEDGFPDRCGDAGVLVGVGTLAADEVEEEVFAHRVEGDGGGVGVEVGSDGACGLVAADRSGECLGAGSRELRRPDLPESPFYGLSPPFLQP